MSREPTDSRVAPDVRDALRDYFREHVCPRSHLAEELAGVWADAAMESIGDTPASVCGGVLAVAEARVNLALLASDMRGLGVIECRTLIVRQVTSALLKAGYRKRTVWLREAEAPR